MKKMIADMHTHSKFSHDGRDDLSVMLEEAQKLGVCFYGTSEHIDYDYNLDVIKEEWLKNALLKQGSADYFHTARHLQEDYEGVMNVAVGVEFGYSDNKEAQERYVKTYETHRPDYVINSVHSLNGVDLAYAPCSGTKQEIYTQYLTAVRHSLDAPYHYDVVGHIGYAARYVDCENVDFDMQTFGAQLDDIFLTIIAKGKILEVNTSSKQLKQRTIPDVPLLQRYYDLGGRKICFGSDAHFPERIAEKWDETVETLKRIGFTHLTIPFRGEEVKIEL